MRSISPRVAPRTVRGGFGRLCQRAVLRLGFWERPAEAGKALAALPEALLLFRNRA